MKPQDQDRDENIAQLLTGHGRCSLLLGALVGLLVIYPYFQTWPFGRLVLNVLQLATILLGVFAVAGRGTTFQVSVLLAAGVLGLYIHRLMSGGPDPYYGLRYGLNIAFYLIVAARLLLYLLRKGAVTADKLHAAISIYLVTAIAWAMAYSIVFWADPGAFVFANRPPDSVSPPFYHFLYFSITTITSTGYGDITPITDQARSLAILEQLFGLFFMTVLIARLAGLYPQQEGARR
jgi:hypothetical protein